MSRRLLVLLATALLLSACGSTRTRQITYALAATEQRLDGTPVKLLATAQPEGQDLVLFYQYRKEQPTRVCGSGAVLVRPGKPQEFLDESHPCAESDTPIAAITRTGVLGEYRVTYGLVFDARVARVTMDFGAGARQDAALSGGAWWVLRRAQGGPAPLQAEAYDQAGKLLQKVNL